ncbi:Crp/Fnr family transcriptional regulator [Maricaulis sp.]|uniref:Crp/Fnr family transcriptional regulator n=1 Tax=Maricaulis sp. TaxID=1486257 RepID=UPI00260D4DA4|nr:Crp/Fnr family transcriptional regulator [Maricaulis sp.]
MDLLDFAITPLRDLLPPLAYEEARRRARRASYSDGQIVHARGDDAARLCIVAQGAVRFGRFQPGGTLNLVRMIGPGAHFGDVAVQRSTQTHDAYAVGPTQIDIVDAASLKVLLDHEPGFAAGLWQANTARLNALLELYDDARTLSVTARLAKVIYLHCGRGALADGVACLQRDLAALLGVSQVSIGNALKELQAARLVEPGYRCVTVPDKARLKAWLRKTSAA